MIDDLTGRRQSNMAFFKPEIPTSQLVDKIGTKFHLLHYVFEIHLLIGPIKNDVRSYRKYKIQNSVVQTGSSTTQPVDKIGTTFYERLCLSNIYLCLYY